MLGNLPTRPHLSIFLNYQINQITEYRFLSFASETVLIFFHYGAVSQSFRSLLRMKKRKEQNLFAYKHFDNGCVMHYLLSMRMKWSIGKTFTLIFAKKSTITETNMIDFVSGTFTIETMPFFIRCLAFSFFFVFHLKR